jgi:hypothetical protein
VPGDERNATGGRGRSRKTALRSYALRAMTEQHRPQSPGHLRIVFSLLHAGYLRHYAEPIRILAAHGHSVHLALHSDQAKDRADDRLLAHLLADCPSVTVGLAPRRHRLDGWRPIAWIVRSFVDILRYGDPRYRDATALRLRAMSTVRERVERRGVDPLSRRIVLRLLEWTEHDRHPDRLGLALRLLAAVEDSIPASRRTKSLIAAQRANVVLASPVVEFASPQVEFIKSAKRERIPCAICVASWDNLTNKGLLRVVPDRVLVWNGLQRDELAEMHYIPRERVVITGGQKFDPWFEMGVSTTRERFARRVGLDPDRPYLLYVCSSSFVTPDEVPAVKRWIAAVRNAGGNLGELGILVRPHPQNASQWQNERLSEYENTTIWPTEGEYPDEGEARADFFDSIFHSAAVVGVSTSAQIEAAIIGRPVYTVLSPEFAQTQLGTLHFQYLRRENGGFVHEARDLETHLAQLRSGIAGADDPDGFGSFIGSFVRPRGRTVPVAPIVASEIERLGREYRPEPDSRRFRRALLRAALTPLALAMSALAAVSWLGSRLLTISPEHRTTGARSAAKERG